MAGIRTYQPYIEKGNLALKPSYATGICVGAAAILGAHIPEPRLNKLRQVRSVDQTLRLDPFKLILPNYKHRILLTQRPIDMSAADKFRGTDITAAGVCLHPEGDFSDTISVVTIPRGVYESDLAIGTAALAHELVHSYGIGHCNDTSCLMTEVASDESLYIDGLRQNPFCDDHVRTLKKNAFILNSES